MSDPTSLPTLSQVRVVLLAAAPVDQLFVHTGGDDDRDRQLLDDLDLSEVKSHLLQQNKTNLERQENHNLLSAKNGSRVFVWNKKKRSTEFIMQFISGLQI